MSKQEIILNTEDNWDLWIKKIKAITNRTIWPYINLTKDDLPANVPELLKILVHLNVRAINWNVNSYEQLSAAQQRVYENARKFYDQDLKQYQRQEDHMREIRKYIMDTISTKKKRLPKPEDSTWDWLIKLRECTEPDSRMMTMKAHNKYMEALKGLKQGKVN